MCSGGCSGFDIHNPSVLSPQMVQAYCYTKNCKAAWYSVFTVQLSKDKLQLDMLICKHLLVILCYIDMFLSVEV